ncbi:MAG: hypothetical protein QNJ97_29100 [Myxococcota bacterium]|nr:hypothetical protein [Myxococcota bacterium]
MSVDYSLLRRAREGVAFLRIYRWDPPCLSFGRNEPATRRYNTEKIQEMGLDTVRRPTGGRAVWHDKELTYSVAAPESTFGTLRETYNIIHATIGDALRRLGAETGLAERPQTGSGNLAGGSCFASPAGGEVVAAGRKLVGSAQVREEDVFLQHGSVLLEDGQNLVLEITARDRIAPVATSLSTLLGREVLFGEVAQALVEETRASWPGEWKTEEPSSTMLEYAKFADPAWTWRR